MSKIIIQNKEKAEVIKDVYKLKYEVCSSGYMFELNDNLRGALKDLS